MNIKGAFQNSTKLSFAPLRLCRSKPTHAKAQRRKGRKNAIAVFFILSLFTFFPFSPFPLSPNVVATGVVSTSTREGRLAVFDDVWETIRARYYDPSLHGVDWLEQRERYRPLAAEARDAPELYATLRRMVSSLHDAHTRIYAPDEKFDWQHPIYTSVGISVREVAGEAVVVSVERDSEALRAGLRAGDRLKSIDGEDALSVFTRRLDEQSSSSTLAATRLRAMATLFAGAQGSTVRVGWVSNDGTEREASLKRERRERELALHTRTVDGYGVATFDAFTPEVAVDFLRALKRELRDARGLVIDLRGNGGGEAEAMVEVASAFLPVGKSIGRFTDRAGRVALEPHTRSAMLFAADRITRTGLPLVILTSERTASAAEIFVAALKETRRATIIGTNTCGCVLAIRQRHTLPDGGALDISEMDYRTPTGTRLEGTGIAPDEKVEVKRRDLRDGYDRAFEIALQRLRVSEVIKSTNLKGD